MKKLISHIEFLILQHEYVIVPGFGGFVMNRESAYRDESGKIIAPSLRIGFNADMRFNDGLLAGSYMQMYDLDYEAAMFRVEESVKEISRELYDKKTVNFGSLGSFKSVDGRMLFEPQSAFFRNHPSVWGFSDIELKPLADLVTLETISQKTPKINLRHIAVGAASVVAAILFGFFTFTMNRNVLNTIQQSGFYMSLYDEKKEMHAEKIGYATFSRELRSSVLSERIEQADAYAKEAEAMRKAAEVKKIVEVKQKRFFVIIGGETDRKRVNDMLSGFKKRGFSNATILESPERFRIYVASFNTQAEADRYLNGFRSKYPSFHDAWVLPRTVTVRL